MAGAFDAYHKWLGIPRGQQPPNHYRLLGIDLFESDPDTIAHAADQRMVYIRSLQMGQESDLCQKILNEIAAARVCLLHSDKKVQYDQQLRQRLHLKPQAPRSILPEQVTEERKKASRSLAPMSSERTIALQPPKATIASRQAEYEYKYAGNPQVFGPVTLDALPPLGRIVVRCPGERSWKPGSAIGADFGIEEGLTWDEELHRAGEPADAQHRRAKTQKRYVVNATVDRMVSCFWLSAVALGIALAVYSALHGRTGKVEPVEPVDPMRQVQLRVVREAEEEIARSRGQREHVSSTPSPSPSLSPPPRGRLLDTRAVLALTDQAWRRLDQNLEYRLAQLAMDGAPNSPQVEWAIATSDRLEREYLRRYVLEPYGITKDEWWQCEMTRYESPR